ncbi:hypothetical protein PUN4_630030 [Paraburkholderia unamae]|nr:hypothetical protein PUN4_630030 [Paraburkholderia unamae]
MIFQARTRHACKRVKRHVLRNVSHSSNDVGVSRAAYLTASWCQTGRTGQIGPWSYAWRYLMV